MKQQTTSRAYRESVPFESPSLSARGSIEIQIVVVPPNGKAVAYGHDVRGNCVSVYGERPAMLELFHRLRAAGRMSPAPKVQLNTDDGTVIALLERGTCPIHMLPEIPDGSSVAWAPY
jgi:hypothetical protein